MPPQSEWPELLEEQAYLVQMLSEVAHDSGALDSTRTLLDTLRADLRFCTIQVADLERESRDGSPKRQDAKVTSSASRFIHRVTASIGSDKDKEKEKEKEKERENYVLGDDERLLAVWIKKRTLAVEVKNLEIRAQILQRRNRHYAELQRRLAAVYARIPVGKGSPSREEEDAEEETHRAQLTLHEVQRIHDRYKALVALLQQGDYALINAGHHLSAADSKVGSAIDAAKRCAVQTAVVVDQAKRIDPSFFEQEETQVLKAGWLAEVFRTTSPDDQNRTHLMQALKPHHTALLSLISRANKRASEHDNATRRAALRSSDASARRDTLKRRVLVACATAEAATTGDMSFVDPVPEKDGLTRMRDITAGLEGLIPAVVSPRGSVVASPSDPSEERPRVGLEKPVARLPSLASPQPRPPPQSHLLSSMQDLASTPSSANPVIDAPPDAQFGSVEKRSRRGSPAVRQTPSPNPSRTQNIIPPTYPDARRASSESTSRQSAPLFDPMRHPSPRQSQELPPCPQNDRQPGPSPLYQSEFAPREDAVPPAQAPPRQAQHLYQDVPPLVVPKQSSQPDVKMPQPSASKTLNRSSDPRYQPPASMSNTTQARPRSSPQPQPSRQQQAQVGPPRDDAIPQAQATPRQGQPMYQDVPPLVVVPKQSNQMDVKTPQPSASKTSNRSSDPRYQPPASMNHPGTTDVYQARPRSSPQPHSSRQQQAQVGPLQPTRESYPDAAMGSRPSRGVSPSSAIAQAEGKPQLHVVSGTSSSVSDPTQVRADIPSVADHPSAERPSVRGILKQPAATAPRRPAAAVGIDTDPWGVRVAAASSSRPQPKIKAMFNLWRSAEGFKQEELAGPARAPAPSEAQSQPRAPSPKRENPRAAMQSLRFAEGVKIIPRPAVDSDPYEDEDVDDGDELPPSPRRGSMLWLHDPEEHVEESDDDIGLDLGAYTRSSAQTSTTTQPIIATPRPANRSESSISSSSSSLYSTSTRQSTETETAASPSSILGTPPSSAISDSSLISYYTTMRKGDDRAPTGIPIAASSHPHRGSRQMSYGSVQSDHELVQSIFPSPAQSNISERDLLFGP